MSRVAVLVVVVLVGGASAGVLASDLDGDGVSTPAELAGPTDPTSPDTDGDGLDDGREVSLGSDPVVADTDADGLADRAEVEVHGTDPTRSDTDSDGLADAAEANEYPTNPTESDTDGDGLDDGAEVREHGADPTKADTDSDGLDDGHEVSLGTDPAAADTDGDGFGDGMEVHDDSMLANADPTRKDVFLEIDYMRGTQVPEEKLKRVQQAFADAPVENPDGSRGITLHVRTSDSPVAPESETSLSSYRNSYYQSAYDGRQKGYFHALVVRDVTDRGVAGRQVGLTSSAIDGMLVEYRPSHVRVAKTVMHELGHNLGLYPNDHRGIDSYDLQPGQYPSVMNYHLLGPCDCNFDYSDGSRGPNDFDDWSHVAANLAERNPNASKVETRV